MYSKFKVNLILIAICCQFCFANCDSIKNIDKHKQTIQSPNTTLDEQPNGIESAANDSIQLAYSKKVDKIPISGPLKQKRPQIADKLKSYTIDGDWRLTKSNWMRIEIKENDFPVLGIDTAVMRIYGRDGCNKIFGDLAVFVNNKIEIGTVGGTKRACRNLVDTDNFRNSLKEIKTFKTKGLNLFLFNKDGKILLEFERIIWEQSRTNQSITVDSIQLALTKKQDRLRNKLLKQKSPKLSDAKKTYTIDGEWQLTKAHSLYIEIKENSFFDLGIDTNAMAIYGMDGCNSIFGDLLIFENNRFEIDRIGGTKVYCGRSKDNNANNFRNSLKEARTFKIKGLNLFLFNKDEKLLLEFERIIWE